MTGTLQNILKEMVVGPSAVQVGVIQFAGKWTFDDLSEPSVAADHEVDFSLNTFEEVDTMLAKLASLKLMGGTASYIGDAIIKAALPMFEESNGGRASIPGALTAEEGRVIKHLVIFTDSVSGEAKSELEQAAALAKLQGVKIYTVGIGEVCVKDDPNQGPCYDESQTKILASSPTKMKSVTTFAGLPALEKDLANIPCIATYAPSSTPTTAPSKNPSHGPTTFPTHKPSVEPTRDPSAGPTEYPTKVPTLPPTPAPTECITRLDLIFVIDGTNSIPDKVFEGMKNEVASFVKNWERKIGLSDVRIAIMQFGGEVFVEDGYDPVINQKFTLEFDLDDYSSADGILGAIKAMKKLGGNITLAEEPMYVAQQVLTNDTSSAGGSLGGRPYVPKAMIIMTDANFFSYDDPLRAATFAKHHGTHIFVKAPTGLNPCSAVDAADCKLLAMSSDQKDVDSLEMDSGAFNLVESVCVAPRKEPTCANVLDVVFVLQTGGNGRTGFIQADENGVTKKASVQLYDDAKQIVAASISQLLVSRMNVHVSVVQLASEPADPCPDPAGEASLDVPSPAPFPLQMGADTAEDTIAVSIGEPVTITEAQQSASITSVDSSHSRRLQILSSEDSWAAGVIVVTASPTAESLPPTEAPTMGAVLVTAEPTPVQTEAPPPPAPTCDWTKCRQTYRQVVGWEGKGGGVGGGSFSQNDVLAQVLGMDEAARDDEIGMFQEVIDRDGKQQCKMTHSMAERLHQDFLSADAPSSRRNGQKVVVLVTDGTDAEAMRETAEAAKAEGVAVMVVELIPSEQFDDGSFQAGGFAQLQEIATQSEDNRFQYRFASPISQLFDVQSIGEQLVMAFCDFRGEQARIMAGAANGAPNEVHRQSSNVATIVGSVVALLVLTAGVLVIIRYWPQPPVVEDVWVLDPTQVEVPNFPLHAQASESSSL
jgi:hypothetical protein